MSRRSDRRFERLLRWPVYPFLLATYPVLLAYSDNLGEGIAPSDTLFPLAVYLAVTGALFSACWLVWRSAGHAAVVASAVVVPCLLFGSIADAIAPLWPGSSIVLSQLVALLSWVALASLAIALAPRAGQRLGRLTELLNVIALVLVLLAVIPIARFMVWPAEATTAKPGVAAASASERTTTRRDIYHFIFDRYGSETSLEAEYGLDNSDFVAWLEDAGFQVIDDARTNYWRTLPSLSSMFRMSLLNDLALEMGSDNPNPRPLQELLRNNPAAATLQGLGYSYAHFGSWYREFTESDIADYVHRPDYQVDFQSAVFGNSAVPFVQALLAIATGPESGGSEAPWAVATLDQVSRVESMADVEGPKLVYAHFLVPHAPYVFLEDGSIDPEHATFESQLRATNDLVKRLIEPLLARPVDEQPVIILQADEGPYPARYADESADFDWSSATDEELLTKFGILSAWYLPGPEGETPLPSGMSLVNTYPEILARYYGLEVERSPDRSFANRNGRLYDHVDVTERIDQAAE